MFLIDNSFGKEEFSFKSAHPGYWRIPFRWGIILVTLIVNAYAALLFTVESPRLMIFIPAVAATNLVVGGIVYGFARVFKRLR